VRGRLPLAVIPLLVAGCGGNQNVLHGESHQEHSIDTLWWVMFGVACVCFALIGFLLLLGRGGATGASSPEAATSASRPGSSSGWGS